MDIFTAAIHGSPEDIRRMKEAGIDINSKNHHGITALRTACILQNVHIVETLIELGARIDRTYVYCAKNSKIIELLKIGIAIDKILSGDSISDISLEAINKEEYKHIVESRVMALCEKLPNSLQKEKYLQTICESQSADDNNNYGTSINEIDVIAEEKIGETTTEYDI